MPEVNAAVATPLHSAALVAPLPVLTAQAGMTPAEGAELLDAARADADGYWADAAAQLEWYAGWTTVRDGTLPDFRYFTAGLTNVAENCVVRHARAHPNRVALRWEREDGAREVWTYGDLDAEVRRFAGALRGLGVRRGDRVGIYLSNIPEAFVAIQACYWLGAIYTVLFAGFSASAVRERLSDAGAKVVVVADASPRRGKPVALKATLDEALGGVASVEKVVVIRRMGLDVPMQAGRDIAYADLMRSAAPDPHPEPMEANDPGFIIYTSGTTSRPKGVVHSGVGFLVGAQENTRWTLNLQPEDSFWCTADVGWLTFPIFTIVGGLAAGISMVVYEGALDFPDAGRFYDLLERYRVNKVFTAPTALRMLRRAGESWQQGRDLSRLQLISLVGEPLDPDTWRWTRDVLGGGRIFVNNTYGQTETGSAWTSTMVGLTATKPGSCGHPLPGFHWRVLEDDGREAKPGEVGYLVLTEPFPCLARTVWGDHARYLETYFGRFPGLYLSGDAAAVDAHGQVWVTGRVDDVINVSGHRLGTMELEAALINHPAVGEAAVIGAADEIKGLAVVAFVVLRAGFEPGATLEREIADALVARVGAIARPRQVVLTHTVPRTRSGKIMRRLLRELVEKGEVTGDLTGLDNPDAIDALRTLLAGSR
jgi:acetyl-CoA synthetase